MDQLLTTLGIDTKVIFTYIISFIILYIVLKKVMIGPISGMLKERRDEIEGSFARISDETAKVEALQADLNRRLAEIEAEGRVKIQEAIAYANKMRDELLAEARTQADQVKERGIAEIENEREKALQTIREHVASLVAQASAKVIGQSMDDTRHHELINQTLDQLENTRN